MKEPNSQVDFCIEVLKRLQSGGVLDEFLLIGSWYGYFYSIHAGREIPRTYLKTRDMDFLISNPGKVRKAVDVAALLKDLGFLMEIRGEGVTRMIHPQLMLDFLAPEKGRGGESFIPIKGMGINAASIRYLTMLSDNPIVVRHSGINIRLPNPVNYGLHKIIVSTLRTKKDKIDRDRELGVGVLRSVVADGKSRKIQEVYIALPPKWRKAILLGLKGTDDLIAVLSVK